MLGLLNGLRVELSLPNDRSFLVLQVSLFIDVLNCLVANLLLGLLRYFTEDSSSGVDELTILDLERSCEWIKLLL